MHQFRKRRSRADQQPIASRDLQAIGCHLFCVERSEGHNLNVVQSGSQENSDLNTCYVDENEGRNLNVVQSGSQENSDLHVCCVGENNHRFSVNQCESHGRSELDTISLFINSRDSRKLKFLIDTRAEI